jgi:outer membrane protein OmpA-like peptidoglycan-associated protein/opacity protein-like surface antigen
MPRILGRRSRALLVVLAGTCVALAGHPAAAEGVQVEVGVTGGVHFFSTHSELGVADDDSLTSPKNAPLFGLRLGLLVHPMFGIELEGVGIPTKDRHNGDSAFIIGARGHLIYNIAPGQIAGGKIVPFVLAGAGTMNLASTSGNGTYDSLKKDTDFEFHAGAGVKFALNQLIHLRLDARAIGAPNTSDNGFSPEFELMGGIGFAFGGEEAPPPVAAPALVRDTDGDGIADDTDRCPTQPGPRENNGCPETDRDGDTVVDRKDKCPDKAGPVAREGCPEEDKDNDGIGDDTDKCPTEPEDMDKFEDEDGCPDPDNDKDGVLDEKDKCPTEPETKNGYQDDDGCPDEVPATVKKFTGVVKGINFRRNSADIKASSFPLLKEAVKVFRDYPDLRVEISGHTSDEGKRDFNMKLSRKRAESVKGFLVSAGIDEKRIGTVGYGPDRPIADNTTKEGQEKNRRIEFRLLSPSETIQTQPEPEDINPTPERKSKTDATKPEGAEKKKKTKAAPEAGAGEKPKADATKPAAETPKTDAAAKPKAEKTTEKPATEKAPAEKPAKAKKPAKGAAGGPPDDEPTPK